MSYLGKDQQFVWHPYTQAQLEEPPLAIKYAKDAMLYTEDDRAIIDAISSWWVTLHGHSNPHIAESVKSQIEKLDQVIFAGFTHEPAVLLAEKLSKLMPGPGYRAFFSDDGSTAVEAAIKMSFQYWFNLGKPRRKIICLRDAYHGDTFGAMSVSARSSFCLPFENFLFEVEHIPRPGPDCLESSINAMQGILDAEECAAFIFEPLVQGAAGMKFYPAEHLDRLIELARSKQVICIADEVFTGFGRTGSTLACDQLVNKSDLFCLSKGITGGVLPLGVTMAPDFIYSAFLSSQRQKMFLHGHSFTGNPISCRAALASLELLMSDVTQAQIRAISESHRHFCKVLESQPRVSNPRVLGTILAFEIDSDDSDYLNPLRDKLYNFYLSRNVNLRPLGNTVYIVPPYCIEQSQLDQVYSVILESLEEVR